MASTSADAGIDLHGYNIMASFARAHHSERMLAFLMRLDAVDSWAVDYKEDEAANALEVKAFVAQLQSFLNADAFTSLDAAPKQYLQLLGGLRSSRCLYLLREAMERNPALAVELERLLGSADQDVLVAVVRRRLEAFNKAQLLGEIFSAERLERITSIMGAKQDERD